MAEPAMPETKTKTSTLVGLAFIIGAAIAAWSYFGSSRNLGDYEPPAAVNPAPPAQLASVIDLYGTTRVTSAAGQVIGINQSGTVSPGQYQLELQVFNRGNAPTANGVRVSLETVSANFRGALTPNSTIPGSEGCGLFRPPSGVQTTLNPILPGEAAQLGNTVVFPLRRFESWWPNGLRLRLRYNIDSTGQGTEAVPANNTGEIEITIRNPNPAICGYMEERY